MESIENTGITAERIILILLREDLRSNKLLLGLEVLGITADRYTLDVSDLVFHLMGCTETEANALMDVYREIMDQAVSICNVEEQGVLDAMAADAFRNLVQAKEVNSTR